MHAFRLSLRTAVTAPFLAVFLVTVGLLAFWQQRQVNQLINQESLRLLDAMSTASRQRLAEYLETPLRVQESIASAVARQQLYRAGDMQPIYAHLIRAFSELYAHYDQISLLSFGGVHGEYAAVRREPDGSLRLLLQDASTQGLLRIFPGLEPLPRPAGLSVPGYDPRVRPWYVHAARVDGPRWSSIYTVAGERGDTTLSAATRVTTSQGLQGVLAADVRLSSINQFLASEPLLGNGHIAVVDEQGYLVAHSSAASVLARADDAYHPPQRMRLSDSPEPALRTAAALLAQRRTPYGTTSLNFVEHGMPYHGQVTPLRDARGIDWRIIVLLPEPDLVSSARADSRNALLGSIALALVGLVLGLWWLRLAIRPIQVTADAAHRLALGDWHAVKALPPARLAEISSLVDAFNDMAQRLQQSFEHMRSQVLQDSLTRLLTRAGLIEQADASAAAAPGSHATLCLLELQNLRRIRDDLGHGTAEHLLQAVASRLRWNLGAQALLARLGSNEFAVLWLHHGTPAHARHQCLEMLDLFAQPFSVGKDDIELRACAGAVAGPLAPGLLPEWLRNASIALGEAQRLSLPCLLFEDGLAQRMLGRTQLATELRHAVDKGELRVYYQPVVDLATGAMVGAEALLRWHSPSRGMVPPGIFIPVAEESDLILSLGEWVLRAAAHDIASRLEQLPRGFELHVNVSARELIQSDFANTLERTLNASGLPPRMLTLELTESMLLDGSDATLQRIAAIKALGVKIAIDDFGTGYSSLAYLSRLRFDCIKIDQSFVGRLPSSQPDMAIVTAVLRIAEGFGVQVVAEGVETREQADTLSGLGCVHAQGYLFERPLPLEQMLAYRSPWAG